MYMNMSDMHLDQLFPGDTVRPQAFNDFGQIDATRQFKSRHKPLNGHHVVIATLRINGQFHRGNGNIGQIHQLGKGQRIRQIDRL